jgi:hypothetical protein
MRDLEGAQQALGEQLVRRQAGDVLAAMVTRPAGRRQPPGDDVEQRGLAGAVRADQPGDRAGDLELAPSTAWKPPKCL